MSKLAKKELDRMVIDIMVGKMMGAASAAFIRIMDGEMFCDECDAGNCDCGGYFADDFNKINNFNDFRTVLHTSMDDFLDVIEDEEGEEL